MMVVANSLAAMVVLTPALVSMRLSLSRERPVSSSVTLQNKKKSARAKPGDYSSAGDDQSCGQQTTFYQQGL
jgi:hypothetical protein